MPISDYHVVGDASLARPVPPTPASSIGYDNTSSGMSATDVQEAIDELASGSGGGTVTGVKGDSESTYRTGNVNITKDNIGLGNVPNVTTDNQKPTVSEASTRVNLASGDTLATIVGKIKKFFSDLKTVAFTGSYSDLTGQPPIPTKTSDLTNDSGYVTANNKVTQTNTTGNADYNVLLSYSTATTTEKTEQARKHSTFKYNPSTGNLQVTQLNGADIGNSPKFTDTTYSLVGAKDSTGLVKNGSTVTSSSGYTACPIISGVPYYKDTNTTKGTSYNAGSCPDNTTFATNGSVARAYSALNSNKVNKSWSVLTVPTPTISGNIRNYTVNLANYNEVCILARIYGYAALGDVIFPVIANQTMCKNLYIIDDNNYTWKCVVEMTTVNTSGSFKIAVRTLNTSYQPTTYYIFLDKLYAR